MTNLTDKVGEYGHKITVLDNEPLKSFALYPTALISIGPTTLIYDTGQFSLAPSWFELPTSRYHRWDVAEKQIVARCKRYSAVLVGCSGSEGLSVSK
jgi:hypothetical protein